MFVESENLPRSQALDTVEVVRQDLDHLALETFVGLVQRAGDTEDQVRVVLIHTLLV